MLRKKYDYPLFRSHRTKALDAVKGLLIDAKCNEKEINIDMNSIPVSFGKVDVRESGNHVNTHMGLNIRMIERMGR